MSMVIVDISISLDGYITAAGRNPEEPLGPGGEVLHDWFLDPDPASQEAQASGF